MFFNSNDCKVYSNAVKFNVNMFAHVAFLITILSLVFIFYTSKIMSDSVTGEVSKLLNVQTDKLVNKLDTFYLQKLNFLASQINNNKLKEMLNANSARIVNNKFVNLTLLEASAFLFIIFIISFIIIKMLCVNSSLSLLLLENLVTFILVGVVEFSFFTFIILKYIPAYPSEASHIFLEEFKKIIKKN